MTKKKEKPNPHLTIFYQNVRGLNGKEKQKQFRENTGREDHDVICLTETMLRSGFDNSLLFDDRYVVFRYDRNLQPTEADPNPKTKGGGVLIAVRRELNPTLLDRPNESEFGASEHVWVDITLANGQHRNICCVYIPGDRRIQMSSYLSSLRGANQSLLENTIIVGDFNMPRVNFNADNVSDDIRGRRGRSLSRNLALFIRQRGLQQFNHFVNFNNVTLDLVFSCMTLVVILARPLVRIDAHHPPILIELRSELRESITDVIFRMAKEFLKSKTKEREEERDKEMARRENERKKEDERDKKAAEKEAERKKQEKRDREKAKRESERKKEEESDRVKKERERKKQEDRDREEARRERERESDSDNLMLALGITALAVGGVGICLACPLLTPVVGKTAAVSSPAVTKAVLFSAAAVAGLFSIRK